MEYGLLGGRLSHSFSPEIHARLGGYSYALVPLPSQEAEAFIASRAYRGLNVTIPYKQLAARLCDRLSPEAAEIGSVNTLAFGPDGALVGHNTDISGFIYMAERRDILMRGRKIVILGSGGTSLTAQAAAKKMGARDIAVISRSGPDNYENLCRHADADVLVNTTPVGMFPDCGKAPVDLRRFPNLSGVLDVVYNPLRTALIQAARELGIPCSSGLSMLVRQAAGSSELWTGRPVPSGEVEEILRALTRSLTNIVLIGMPGSGKTTLAGETARRLGREVADTDKLVENAAGRTIPEIFTASGEAVFRDLESAAVREAGKRSGCVIACGGGVVLREENLAPLRQNSVIIYLERNPEQLPRDGRPLSRSADLSAMLEARLPLYRRFADASVNNDGPLSATADKILEVFYEISRD